jgi:hypothetical protein
MEMCGQFHALANSPSSKDACTLWNFMEEKNHCPRLDSMPERPSLYKFNSFSLLIHLSNLLFREVD